MAILSPTELANYAASVAALRPVPGGVSLLAACSEYARAALILDRTGLSLAEAASIAKAHAAGPQIRPITVGDLVEEFIEDRRRRNRSPRYLEDVRSRLRTFAAAFKCGVSVVRTHELQTWLASVAKNERNRANFRGSVVGLFRWAQAQGYLARDRKTEAEHLEAPRKGRVDSPGIYTPEEFAAMLAQAPEGVLPAFLLGGFAGLRTAEIHRLNWRNIDLAAGHIEITAANAKTATRRLVPIQPALAAWLKPHARPFGRVADWKNVNSLCRNMSETITAAKVKAQPNGLRHSFASYRLAAAKDAAAVALEMGNSPRMLFTNYRELVRPPEVERWWSLRPAQPGNIVALRA